MIRLLQAQRLIVIINIIDKDYRERKIIHVTYKNKSVDLKHE